MGPAPAVAAVRNAVRACVADLAPGDLVLAACSGGADSLALAAALAFVAPRAGLRAGAVTVDHGLQEGSAARAASVAATAAGLGLDPVRTASVSVEAGTGGAGGPEAAARTARYAALSRVAAGDGAAAVLLGLRRPVTAEACAALGLDPWQDPHNADRRFARVRVRLDALPALEAALGPGVAEALARTAGQLRADAEVLEKISAERTDGDSPLSASSLAELPGAVRTRVLRSAALAAGCPASALTAGHVARIEELVTGWHGQRWIDLPGGVRASRRAGQLCFES